MNFGPSTVPTIPFEPHKEDNLSTKNKSTEFMLSPTSPLLEVLHPCMYSLNMSHIILHCVGNTIFVHVHSRIYNLRCPKSQFGLTDACHIITTQFVATRASAVVRSFGIVATVTTATIIAGTFIDICINQNELSYRVTFGRGEGEPPKTCV